MNFIEQLPVSFYWLFYLAFTTVIVLFYRLIIWLFYRQNYQVPTQKILSPYEIVTLKKGITGLLELTLINLWQRQLIAIQKKDSYIAVHRKVPEATGLEQPLEKFLFGQTEKSRMYQYFFKPQMLKTAARLASPFRKHLEKLHLLPDAKDLRVEYTMFIISAILILGVGFYRTYFNWIEGSIAGIPAGLTLLSGLVLFIFRPQKDAPSPLGKAFLNHNQSRYKSATSSLPHHELLYAASFLGLGYLAKTSFAEKLPGLGAILPDITNVASSMSVAAVNEGGSGTGCGG